MPPIYMIIFIAKTHLLSEAKKQSYHFKKVKQGDNDRN